MTLMQVDSFIYQPNLRAFQETYENEMNGIHVVLSAAKRLCIVKTHIYIYFFFFNGTNLSEPARLL